MFILMGDDIVEVSTKKRIPERKIVSYNGKWSEQSKAKHLKQFEDEKRANLFMARMEKQMEKP